ncbi:Nucleotidyltransferase domain-containing protein [Elsinoe fawcettii]|nr:Nucleotidyltransferase domain-containing protein [Elsinoe fawcettii]
MSYDERRRPPSPRRDTFRFGAGNSQANFNFDAPRGPTASFPSTSGQNRDRFRGRDRRRDFGRGRGRGGWKKFTASDREIFRARRSPTPERMAGMNNGDSRFRVLDELPSQSESDEADDSDFIQLDGSPESMEAVPTDLNPDDDMSSKDEHPRAKRARTTERARTTAEANGISEQTSDPADSKPKWSNPDPYTSLPPPSQTDAPKKDVVAMIRKAKVENVGRDTATSQADDFISLNFDDEAGTNEEGEQPSHSEYESESYHGPAARTRGQRTSNGGSSRARDQALSDRWPPAPRPAHDHYDPNMRRRSRSPHDRYTPPRRDYDQHDRYPHQRAGRAADEYTPPDTYFHDLPQASTAPNAQGKRKRQDGPTGIAGNYLPSAHGDATPWMAYCRSESNNPGEWLHDELNAFLQYATPKPFEREMRADLIRRVNDSFRTTLKHVSVSAFGSYATDLYLPVSDMDLVAMSSTYRNTGYAEIGQSPKDVRKINGLVFERGGLSRSSNLILHAKVPIIKFTDISTGIHVDVSFENDSGLLAIPTVKRWVQAYPALPHIVYPIKHLLATRHLNDVSTGGLGGFSIICLIVFRLHDLGLDHSPQWLLDNLDYALMDVLDWYGNKFDYRMKGLDMLGMREISKFAFRGDRRPQPGRLLIVDPNNSANDVSGGTSKIPQIFRLFQDLHKRLGSQLSMARAMYQDTRQKSCILRCMLDSGFDAYHYQRERLRKKYDQIYGGRDDDVQFVSTRSLGTGRSHDDAIDLTSVGNHSVHMAPPSIQEARKSNRSSRKERQQAQQQQNGLPNQSAPGSASGRSHFSNAPSYDGHVDDHHHQQADSGAGMPTSKFSAAPGDATRRLPAVNTPGHTFHFGTPLTHQNAPVPAPVTAFKHSGSGNGHVKVKNKKGKKEANIPKPKMEQKAKVQKSKAKPKSAALTRPSTIAGSSKKAGAAPNGSSAVDAADSITVIATKAKKRNKKSKKEKAGQDVKEQQRAAAFMKQYPGVACPPTLSRADFKKLAKKQTGQ